MVSPSRLGEMAKNASMLRTDRIEATMPDDNVATMNPFTKRKMKKRRCSECSTMVFMGLPANSDRTGTNHISELWKDKKAETLTP